MDVVSKQQKSDNEFAIKFMGGMIDGIKGKRFNLSNFSGRYGDYSTEVTYTITLTATPKFKASQEKRLERDRKRFDARNKKALAKENSKQSLKPR